MNRHREGVLKSNSPKRMAHVIKKGSLKKEALFFCSELRCKRVSMAMKGNIPGIDQTPKNRKIRAVMAMVSEDGMDAGKS